MTVSVWINPNAAPANNASIVGKVYDWQLCFHSSRAINFTRWGGYQNFFAGAVSLSQWHHIVFTLSSGGSNNARIYVDGGVPTTGTITTPLNANAATTGISWYVQSDIDYFNGLVDDLRIYNRALSATDVAELYNNDLGRSKLQNAVLRNAVIK